MRFRKKFGAGKSYRFRKSKRKWNYKIKQGGIRLN